MSGELRSRIGEAKALAEEVLKKLKGFRLGIEEFKEGINRMPLIFRAFVVRDLVSGTGLSHDEWLAFTYRLIRRVETVIKALERVEASGGSPESVEALKEALKPLLERVDIAYRVLRGFEAYLLSVPGKASKIPRFMPLSEEMRKALEEAPKHAGEVRRLAEDLRRLVRVIESMVS